MKKLIAMLLALVMVVSMAACGAEKPAETEAPAAQTEAPAAAEEAAPADEVKTVGISMPTKSLERWNRDGSYLKEEFEKAGYKVELTYSDNDVTQQNNDISNLVAGDIDLLIVAAIDGEALTQVLGEAKDAGVPVIAYDRLIMNTDAISYYVSFDNYTVGTLQGQFVETALDLKNAGDKSYNLEFTGGDPADNNARFFFQGAVDVLNPYIEAGTLKVVSGQTEFEQVATAQWNTDTALARMQNVLASYYSDGTILDAVVCSNDSTALGSAQAITTDYAGGNAPIITGQDGDIANLRNIVDGIQTMTVYKNVANEAVATLELAKAILAGEKPAAELAENLGIECAYDTSSYDNGTGIIPSYLLVPTVITKDNLQDLVDTGLYAWDGDYLVSTAK